MDGNTARAWPLQPEAYLRSSEPGVAAADLAAAVAGRGAGLRRVAWGCFSTALWRTWYQPGPKLEQLPPDALAGRCLCSDTAYE